MQFLFALYNHNEVGQRSLEDVIGIMGHQMRALGHKAEWWPDKPFTFLSRDTGINIVVEGFTPASIEVMAKAHSEGARFVILATEEPSEKGFNQGTQREMVKRQQMFPDAARYAEGIICLVPGDHVTSWYGQFAPSAYSELGYAPTLVRPGDFTEPDFEFGFYGSLTKRRLRILKRLAEATCKERAVKIMADFKTQAERDVQMRRARVIVQLRKFDDMGLVSSSRCNTALSLGRPVVAEPHLLSRPWDEIVRFAPSIEAFISEALLMSKMWKSSWADQFAKFKAKLSPQDCVGQALDKIGVLGDKAASRAVA